MLTAAEAKKRLIEGNQKYLEAETPVSCVSRLLRKKTKADGQEPYAVIITCSDSRVIPESIFSADLGDLFVIRVAGNVLDDHQLGSIEYAAEHLGTRLIIMLGHTKCGAVDAAIKKHGGGFIGYVIDDIIHAIGDETDDYKASCMNIRHGVETIRREFQIHPIEDERGLEVAGAIYDIETGQVDFL